MGRKKFYMICVALFTVCSFLCGIANTLPLLIVARILQARAEEASLPASRPSSPTPSPSKSAARPSPFTAWLSSSLPPSAPLSAAGSPTLQLALDLLHQHPHRPHLALTSATEWWEDPPHLKLRKEQAKHLKIDFMGLASSPRVGCLEFTLDKGQEKDWFGDPMIRTFAILAAATLIFFTWWEWHHPDPIVDLKLLKKSQLRHRRLPPTHPRMVLFGSTVLIPQYLQVLLGYTPNEPAWFSPPPASS